MQSLSKLKAGSTPLVLDASVVINLVASNCMDGILMSLKRPIIVTENVCAEFSKTTRDGRTPEQVIENLKTRRRIEVVRMSDEQFDTFLRLTGCLPPDDLGDGEAATLACADGAGCAVIDDSKAIRVATRDFPHQAIYCSLDLFCSEQVLSGLGRTTVAQAVYDAIKVGRMRVPHSWRGWISNMLGKARVAELPFLTAADQRTLQATLRKTTTTEAKQQ